MNSPLLSVIVTTFNRAELLRQCLISVFAQDYSPIEVIVVDDGSTDHTEKVVANFAGQLHYTRNEHSGIAVSRNIGCLKADGKYIAFVDDDDMMHPHRLAVLSAALTNAPDAICAFGQGSLIDTEGRDLKQPVWTNLPSCEGSELIQDGYDRMIGTRVTVTPLNSLFSKDAGEQIGWFDEEFLHGCEDTDFFMRLSWVGPIVYVPDVITYVRRNTETSLTKDKLRSVCSKLQLFEKHIRLNAQFGDKQRVSALRNREYHLVKEIMLGGHDLRNFQKEHGVNLYLILSHIGVKRLLYLLYLRYLKRSLDSQVRRYIFL